MRSALALVIALLTAHIQAEGLLTTNPNARVRPMQTRVETLLATGMDRSADVPATGATHRALGRDRLHRGAPRLARRRRRLDAVSRAQRDRPLRAHSTQRRLQQPHAGRPAGPRTAARRGSRRTRRGAVGRRPARVLSAHGRADRARQLRLRARRGTPATWCATRSFSKPGDLRLARGVSLDERRLLDGSSFVARRAGDSPRLALSQLLGFNRSQETQQETRSSGDLL